MNEKLGMELSGEITTESAQKSAGSGKDYSRAAVARSIAKYSPCPLHIGILGTRGIPASYGGFETFAEELSTRLVQRGHHVTVYGRRFPGHGASKSEMVGNVRLRRAFTFPHKYLETPVAALTSFLDVLRRNVDVILLCNAANSPFAWIPRLAGIPLAINVDGIERNRRKWSSLGRLWYQLGERSSVLFATRVVADAQVISQYYREHFHIEPEVIAYGAEPKPLPAGPTLQSFGLTAGRYLLYVSRLEPENNALGVVQAYSRVTTDLPLVVVGDAPYAKEYIAQIKHAADQRVIFTGFQFGESYRELRSNCYAYVQATEVGGTHPALVEAMAYGNCILANDVPEHREVLEEAGLYYPKNDFNALSALMEHIVNDVGVVASWREKARALALLKYSWDRIVDQYEELLCAMVTTQKRALESPRS